MMATTADIVVVLLSCVLYRSLVCSIVFVKFWRDIDQQKANGFFNGEVIG